MLPEVEEKPFIAKDAIRQKIKRQINSLTDKEKQEAGIRVAELFINSIPLEGINKISGYYPIDNELNVKPLMNELRKLDKKICLPVMKREDNPMIFRSYDEGDVLCLDRIYRRISEPISAKKIMTPQIMILPLLAFDRKGSRLGYGRGYYDRTLAHLRRQGRKIVAVGVGYSVQLLDQVPYDKYDQKLDFAVTEKEVIKF